MFFRTVDSGNAPLRVQVRTVDLGFPTLNVIGKTVTLRPTTTDANGNIISNIQTSDDGSLATNVKFPEPIYLAPGREYAIVIISANSDEYTMWTAIMGEKSVEATSIPPTENAASAVYERQFALGSLFKLNNVILSPHIAGVTVESTVRMATETVQNVLDVLDDKINQSVVVNNKEIGM